MLRHIKQRFQDSLSAGMSADAQARLGAWARSQHLEVFSHGEPGRFHMDGHVSGRVWRMERGRSSRPFIQGYELRARVDCGTPADLSVVLMTRALRDQLSPGDAAPKVSDMADSVFPQPQAVLLEEQIWLRRWPAITWLGMPALFWERFVVLSNQRQQASVWLHPGLADLLLELTQMPRMVGTPLTLVLLRGRVYLRMQHTPTDLAVLQQGVRVFLSGAGSAIGSLSSDVTV